MIKQTSGIVQIVKNKKMNQNRIVAKYYALHLSYFPLSIVYSLFATNEDKNTIFLFLFLVLLVSVTLYIYNFVITVISNIIFKGTPFVSFILPVIILIPLKFLFDNLDFGGKYGFIILLVGNLFVNVFTWKSIINLKKK
ncbi:hypothetical protein SAMN06296427_1082 [Moheibacter sediminis]|uniref:Uncharacterized protein n=2 Tax=Moheibacter sediminis TaxID=1434700 RepID=A0A1W2BYR6_9FLAO|nr:hypothetical protein SAMN06296427_1082 [Moheibacter sediminis]